MIDGLYQRRQPPALLRLAWFVITAAIVYLSLYPLAGWRLRQPSPWSFLAHGLPRYYGHADVVANIAAYVVYGMLFTLAWHVRRRPWLSAALAAASGLLLSLLLESLQSYLPTRVPSLLDVYANAIGAVAGAAAGAAIAAWRSAPVGTASRISLPWYEQGPAIGWALLVTWLLVQLPPQRLLFSTGHWPGWLLQGLTQWLPDFAGAAVPWAQPVPDAFRSIVETSVVATTICVVGVLVMDLVRTTGARIGWITGLLVAALAVRAGTAPPIYTAAPLAAWLTAGAQAGIVVGAIALYAIGAFSRTTRLAIGAVLVALALVLVNLGPEDPYFLSSLSGRTAPRLSAMTPSLRSLIGGLGTAWPLLAFGYFAMRAWALRRRGD